LQSQRSYREQISNNHKFRRFSEQLLEETLFKITVK